MVSIFVQQIQQVDTQLQTLETQKEQAKQLERTPIPVRRFRAGVDVRQQQAQALEQRRTGREAGQQISQEQERLRQLRKDLQEQERLRIIEEARRKAQEERAVLLRREAREAREEAIEQVGTAKERLLGRIEFLKRQREQKARPVIFTTEETARDIEARAREDPELLKKLEGRVFTFFKEVPEEILPGEAKPGGVFIEPPVTFLGGLIGRFERRGEQLKTEVTDPFIFQPLARRGIRSEEITEAFLQAERLTPLGLPSRIDPRVRTFRKEFIKAQIEDIEEQPLKQIVLFGAGVGLGVTFKTIGIVTTGVGGAVGGLRGAIIGGRIGTVVTTTGGLALGGLFVADIAKEFGVKARISERPLAPGVPEITVSLARKDLPTLEESARITGIAFKDILLVGGGAIAGERIITKLQGRFRTIGLREIPLERISEPKVLKGETRFPLVEKGETLAEVRARFFEPKLPSEVGRAARGFKATDIELIAKATTTDIGKIIRIEPGGKKDVLTGRELTGIKTIKSEFPGEFIADLLSPVFLRTAKEQRQLRLFSFFEDIGGQPTVARITLRDIVLPKEPPGTQRVLELQRLLGGRRGLTEKQILELDPKLPPGEAIITGKQEREAIIVRTTEFAEIKKEFFVKVEGVRVPIVEKVAIGADAVSREVEGFTKILSKIERNLAEASSVGRFPEPSLVTPSRVGLASLSRIEESSITPRVSPSDIISDVSRSTIPPRITSLEPSISEPPIITEPPISPISEPPITSIPSRITEPPEVSEASIISPIPSRAIRIPEERIPGVPFRQRGRRRRPEEEIDLGLEEIRIVPGFTARALDLRKVISEKDLIKEIKIRRTGLGFREKLEIIP